VIRNGVDLQELAVVDNMVYAKLMWAVGLGCTAQYVMLIEQSFSCSFQFLFQV